jgi:hypothetical protein
MRFDAVLADIAAASGAGDAEDEATAQVSEDSIQRRGRRPLPKYGCHAAWVPPAQRRQNSSTANKWTPPTTLLLAR